MRFVPVGVVALAMAASAVACGSSSGSGAPAATSAAPSTAAPNAAPAAAAPNAGEGAGNPAGAVNPPGAASGAAAAASDTTQAGSAPPTPASSTGIAPPGSMTVTTKAVELRVEGVTTAKEIGGRQARAGHEFVIVDTSWKNVIPLVAVDKTANSSPTGGLSGFGTGKRPPPDPKNVTMESTPYVVPNLPKLMWLLSDERYADTVDLEATVAVPDHLSEKGFGVAKLNDVVRGKVVFEAPANATYRAFQFYDVDNGYALITLSGTKPARPATIGPMQQNDVLQLGVSEAGFGPAGRQAPAGQRYYTVGLRGSSRSPKDIIDVPMGQFVYAQNDRGCVSQPAPDVTELWRPFGNIASFTPTGQNEGQVAFLVPDDTKNVRVLVTPARSGAIVLPTGAAFTPSWPAPISTVQDGTTLRLLILPMPARPASLPAPAAGRSQVVLDLVIENLNPSKGIDFQTTMQLRLLDGNGGFTQPSPVTSQLTCTLGDEGVIPAGQPRRFMVVYDVPANMPIKLQYRGFEKDETVVEIRK